MALYITYLHNGLGLGTTGLTLTLALASKATGLGLENDVLKPILSLDVGICCI